MLHRQHRPPGQVRGRGQPTPFPQRRAGPCARTGGAGLGCTAAACGYGTGVGESAAATAAGGMQGFPAAPASFIGRAGAVRDVVALLGECRLVTVTGPGGVGKTRLAGQVAGWFADGARLTELAAVRSGLSPGGPPCTFRTALFALFHAASCRFRYSSWTSCGVL